MPHNGSKKSISNDQYYCKHIIRKYKYSYIEGVIASDTPGSKKNMIHIMLAKKRFRGLLEIIIILWDIAANL